MFGALSLSSGSLSTIYVGSSICSRFCSSVGTRSDVPIFVDSSSLLFRDRDSTTDDVVFLFPSRVLLCYHRLDF